MTPTWCARSRNSPGRAGLARGESPGRQPRRAGVRVSALRVLPGDHDLEACASSYQSLGDSAGQGGTPDNIGAALLALGKFDSARSSGSARRQMASRRRRHPPRGQHHRPLCRRAGQARQPHRGARPLRPGQPASEKVGDTAVSLPITTTRVWWRATSATTKRPAATSRPPWQSIAPKIAPKWPPPIW